MSNVTTSPSSSGGSDIAKLDPRVKRLLEDESLPAHLREGALAGDPKDDGLDQFVRPSRVKVVQSNAKQPISDMFRQGDVILTPMLTPLAKKGESFQFVPLFFWPEWITINPLGSDTMIRDRSLDMHSEIARKARDETRRKELVAGTKDKYLTHRETLNYIVQVVGNPEMYDMQVIMSFSSAEHKTGSNLAGLLKSRRPIKMYGIILKASTSERRNDKGQWWGLDITQPLTEEGPALVLDEDEYRRYENMNVALRQLISGGRVVIDHEQDLKEAQSTGAEPRTEF